MSGRQKKGKKKKPRVADGGNKDQHDLRGTTPVPPMITTTSLSYSKEQDKSTTPSAEQSSVFFGYDLPDDVTEDEILSFLEEFQQSIVSVDVVLNEKHGNYAKVTFATHSDAKAAIKCYGNQPWYDMGINVTMKPWKDKEEFTTSSPKKCIPSAAHVKHGSHGKSKSTKHCSMFFGYDLPDYITEEDIVSYLQEFEQCIVSVEIILNEKHGNYARVTFKTSADAQEAMRHYSGHYWYKLGVHVVLKPWKDKEMPQKKKKQQHTEYTQGEADITHDRLNVSGEDPQQNKNYSSTGSFFLLPYPESHETKTGKPIYSEDKTKSTESKNKQKKLTESSVPHKDRHPKEYTIKISGLSFDVEEAEILQLVKPFGDLTSPVRIARYPESGICYAYANYYSANSAIAAVSELDETKFKGVKIHVCHRGELRVDHSCRKVLQELAEEQYDDTSIASDDDYSKKYTIKISGLSFDVKKGHILKLVKPFGDLTSPVRIASYPENGICYAYADYCNPGSAIEAVSKLDKSDFNGNKIHVCHKSELGVDHSCRKILLEWAKEEYDDKTAASFDSVKQVQVIDSPQVSSQESNEKSRNVISYASVTKSPPKPVKDLHGEKPSKGVAKKRESTTNLVDTSPEKSNINSSYHSNWPSHEFKCLTKDDRQLSDLSIDSLPGLDTVPTEKTVTKAFENVASYASIAQTSPKSVKVPHVQKPIHILAQEAEFSSDNINASISMSHDMYCEHQALNELYDQPSSKTSERINFQDDSSVLHAPPTVSPYNQATDVFKYMKQYTYIDQSSLQNVSIVQDVKPGNILQQQPKTNPDDAKSSCILQVTNLHPDACVQDLERYFKPYGVLAAPISIRFHAASDSCSAVVHYISPDAAQNAIIRLNGCDFSGYQMHIVRAGYKGTEITIDKTPVVSGPTTVGDIAVVGPTNFRIPAKNMGENVLFSRNESSNTLSGQKIGFPIIKAMSKNLQNFIKGHLNDKITELQQSGGKIEWTDSSVIISGADQSVLNKFDNDILCSLEEKTESLFADQWNKLLHVDFDNNSFLSQLIEEYDSEVKIDLDYETKSITFVGEEQMVLKVRQTLFAEVCQELLMLGYQMLVLITCIPNLTNDIETKWNVTVTGFVEGSTCLNFKGDNIQMAYNYVTKYIGFCKSKEFPCSNIDSTLVTVAIMHIKKVGIAVIICNSDGERLLSSAKTINVNVLVVHSLSIKEIDQAICVLESSPHKKEVELPSEDMMDKLQDNFEEFKAVYTVSIQISIRTVIIQGYTETDVAAVRNRLKKLIDDLTVRTVEFSSSKEKMQFLKHIMFDKPTEQAKTLLSFLSESLSLIVENRPVSITLTGNLKAIDEGIKCIEQQLLGNFQVEAVHSRCHPNFLSQIDIFIREPLERELNVVIYYFPVHGSERFEPTKTVGIYIKVYSTDSADFKKACEVLTKLDPKTHHFPMSEDDLRCIAKACDDGTIDLHKIGDSYRSRIELWHNQGVVVIHTFSQTEAEDCLQSLKQHLSTLKVVIQINVTTLQLKYLMINKQDALKLCKVTTEASESVPPKLRLEGTRSQVERSRKVLQQLLSGIVSRSHKQTHNKYILMWRKCWEEVNNEVSQDKKLYVELSTAVSNGSLTCELIVVGEDVQKIEDVISSVRKIDGSFKECVISTDAMGVKIVNEGLKSGKIEVKKDYIYHIEITANSIIVVSPYCMQTEEIHQTIEEYIAFEKKTRRIVKQSFTLQYSFLAKILKFNWSKVQEIAKNNKILSINLVTDPCCAIEVKGNEAAIKQAEPEILQHILSLESDVACSVVLVDYYSRPALTSPEFLQLCKELENDLAVSLTVQMYPEVLSSAIVQLNESEADGTRVEVCEGSISLDYSEVIVNFTDVNLNVCKALKAVVGESVVIDCTHHITSCGPLAPGKAINFCKFGDDGNPTVIHAIMPNWINGKSGESNLIIRAVSESLKLAAECNAKSVSLPFISCIDKDLPAEFLAEACLSAVYEFCEQFMSIEKIQFVLPTSMAGKFQNEFTTGLLQPWIVEQESDHRSPTPGDTAMPSTSLPSLWLWRDDDGKYHCYKSAENNVLNQESVSKSSCSLRIGKFSYIIDFIAMTQTNTSTMRVRNIKKITNDHIWQYRNDLQKWKRFSLKDSIKIEIMYVTQTHKPLIIDGQVYSYNFDNMTQRNNHNFSKTSIRRTAISMRSIKTKSKQKTGGESKILVYGSSPDMIIAKEKLECCVKSLSVVKYIDVQPNLVSILDKHVHQIQKDYRVEIHPCPDNPADSSDTKIKYNVTGYKSCVQEAITAVYQILTSSSTSSVVQSFARPVEWEPQSDPIELKDVQQGLSEWNKILNRMQETIPSVNIISIKRIQNEHLWEKYCQHKERMGRKGLNRINEMELFHGTSSNLPEDIYKSEEGFDMRFSRSGMWGQGNYFAESAQYSCSYAYATSDTVQLHSYKPFTRYGFHTSSSIKQMFLAKVLTGDSFASPSDKTLRMPPYKPSASSEKVRYDTVNGITQGSKVYITYSNDKAYPLYLISFT